MALVTFLGDDMHLEERIKYEVEQKHNLGEVRGGGGGGNTIPCNWKEIYRVYKP